MFTRVEGFCLLKSVKSFDSYDWTNVRRCHLTCVSFVKRAF